MCPCLPRPGRLGQEGQWGGGLPWPAPPPPTWSLLSSVSRASCRWPLGPCYNTAGVGQGRGSRECDPHTSGGPAHPLPQGFSRGWAGAEEGRGGGFPQGLSGLVSMEARRMGVCVLGLVSNWRFLGIPGDGLEWGNCGRWSRTSASLFTGGHESGGVPCLPSCWDRLKPGANISTPEAWAAHLHHSHEVAEAGLLVDGQARRYGGAARGSG